jgi:hypothetical protein
LSAWAAGNNNGSLDTGAIAATTGYHVHLIRKDLDGTIDVLLSTSATSPTMPSGWTARRRIGSIRTDGASQIVAFTQFGDEVLWDVPFIDVDVTNPGTAAALRSLTVPSGLVVTAFVSAGMYAGSNNTDMLVSSPAVSDATPQVYSTATLSNPATMSNAPIAAGWAFQELRVRTNTSGQIRTRHALSGAADHVGIVTRGYLDQRGK